MTHALRPFLVLGFVAAVGCGEVNSPLLDAAGSPDGQVSSIDGALDPDGAIAVDAAIDAVGISCGDGVVNGSEVCDHGSNNGMYGYCNAGCTALGPRCGDSVVNGPESCDAGGNNGMYGFCNAACSALGPRCGDNVVNGPETCDSGGNNGAYGFCNASCSALGPRCGDGVQNGPESCDSGGNNGAYGFCNGSCTGLGPRCGDGVPNGPESCDSGGNNGGYGFCNGSCSALGPRCGDSITNGPESCDAATVYSSSMAAGVCRPDCAGTVQQRSIGVTANRVAPGQGGVAGVDSLCQSSFGASYRALLVDGTTRIASNTLYAGNGQVGWVLQPYTRYVSAETGLLVFITDHTRLLGAVNGQAANLYNPIRAADDGWGAWTGANPGWTTGHDCNNWSSNLSTDSGLSTNTTSTTSGTFPNNGAVSNCAQLRRFFCVQQ